MMMVYSSTMSGIYKLTVYVLLVAISVATLATADRQERRAERSVSGQYSSQTEMDSGLESELQWLREKTTQVLLSHHIIIIIIIIRHHFI